MLPSVASVACDCPAIVVGVAANAADLAVVLGHAGLCGSMVVLLVVERMIRRRKSIVGEVRTVDSLDRVRGVCHAILSVEKVLEAR